MTIPNIFTIFRLILILPIALFLLAQNNFGALILIFVAWVTDLLDGYLARKLNQISALGKILDPLADKLLVFIIVSSLIISETIPLYLGIIIVARDILILTAGLYAWLKHKYLMQSNWIGKLSAFIIGFTLMIFLLYRDKYPLELFHYIIILTVVISFILYSDYFIKTLKSLK